MGTQKAVALSILALLGLFPGCHSNGEPARTYVQVTATDGGPELPELPMPFSADDVRALREGFDWNAAEELAEFDDEGRPALYYVEVYLSRSEDLDLLSLARIPHDALPMFSEERTQWEQDGSFGTLEFAHTDEGATLAYAFMPGAIYNLARASGLAGTPVWQAVRLRDVPVAAAQASAGYLDLDYLLEQGFDYGLSAQELADAGGSDTGSTTAPLLGRIVRAIIQAGRGIVDAIRMLAAAIQPKRDFSMRMRVLNTDDLFYDQSLSLGDPGYERNVMRQAWGERRGQPIRVQGAKVAVQTNFSLALERIDENGYVEATIGRRDSVQVYLRLRNDAAIITAGGVWEKRVQLYSGSGGGDRNDDVALDVDVRSELLNVFALVTDGYNYLRDVVGHTPFRAVINAGPVVAGEESNESASPCWTFFGFGTFSLGGGRGWSVAANIVAIFADWDITVRGPDLASRGVVSHEYGHFAMCDLMFRSSRRDFGRAWGELIGDIVEPYITNNSDATEPRMIAEGWADFFAAQVMGGTNYTRTLGSRFNDAIYYCSSANISPSTPCLEDNLGGPSGSFPGNRRGVDPDPLYEGVGIVASILHDAVDGIGGEGVDTPSHAGLWDLSVTPPEVRIGTSLSDESVQLPGAEIDQIIQNWSHTSNWLRLRGFYNSLSTALELSGHDTNSICSMFALHTQTGFCTDLISDGGGFVPSRPILTNFRISPECSPVPHTDYILAEWRTISAVGNRYRVELLRDDVVVGTSEREYRVDNMGGTTAGGRMGFWTIYDLPDLGEGIVEFDTDYVLRVRSITATQDGEPLDVPFRTSAEGITTPISATPLPGGARITWMPGDATDYLIQEVNLTTGARRDVGYSTEGAFDVIGLSENSNYRYFVHARNADGQVNDACTGAYVDVTPAAPVAVYLSDTFGDDSHPEAGSALYPYRTLAAALAGADARGASVIRMEWANFTSASPVSIPGIAIELEGGYGIMPDATWVRIPLARTGLIAPAQMLDATTIPGTARTLGAARTPRSAFSTAPSANVLLDGVDLVGNAGPSATNLCGVALSVMPSARVRLEDSRVAMVDVPSANGCRIGILLPNSTSAGDGLWIDAGSSVAGLRGSTSVTLPTATTLIGVATGTRPVLRVTDSRVFGLDAPGANAIAATSWVGVLSVRSAGIEFSRATVAAAQLPQAYVSPSGFVAAVDLAQGGAVRIDNSFLATPTGATSSIPLYAEGTMANPLTAVDLTWTTVSAGRDYVSAAANVSGNARAVYLDGYLQSVRWVNNVFAVAAAHTALSTWVTRFPDSGFTSGPAVSVVASGNVFSAPLGSEMVHVACGEFVGCGFSESEVNGGDSFSFMSGWNASFSGNYVLPNPVGIGAETERRRVYLDATGRVRSANSAGSILASPTGTVTLLDDGGTDLVSAPDQSRIDLGGNDRATVGQRRDIGAWIF